MANTTGTNTGLHKVVLFDKTTGINDNLDPVRVGEGGLAKGENVVVDLSGAIKRRNGMTSISSSGCHSLFSCGMYGLGVFNNTLSVINSGLSISSLGVSVGGGRVSYVRGFDGASDVVYFTNRIKNGKVVNKAYRAWTVSDYVGVQSTAALVSEWLSAPPVGQLLEIFNGRMFIASNNLLYASEVYDFARFSPMPFVFESNITMLAGVTGGVYVGTQDEILFLAGADAAEFSRSKVYSGQAILGSSVKVSANEIGLQSKAEALVFAVSGEGICVGDSSGMVQNLTKVSIDFLESSSCSACVTKDKQYIISIGE